MLQNIKHSNRQKQELHFGISKIWLPLSNWVIRSYGFLQIWQWLTIHDDEISLYSSFIINLIIIDTVRGAPSLTLREHISLHRNGDLDNRYSWFFISKIIRIFIPSLGISHIWPLPARAWYQIHSSIRVCIYSIMLFPER